MNRKNLGKVQQLKRPTPIDADILERWIERRGTYHYRIELEHLLWLDLEYGILDMGDRALRKLMREVL